MHIPLTVRYIPDHTGRDGAWRGDPFPQWQQSQSRPEIPVWTGVPLRRSEVADSASLRLLDAQGRPVPAQFDTEATWSDGSLQWVLVSFVANGGGEKGQGFTLTSDASLQAAKVDSPVKVLDDTNTCRLDTGPMRVRINKQAMHGLSQVWLDIDGDGAFSNEELISTESPMGGILAVDAQGRTYGSGSGRVRRVRVERSGPIHAVICVEGDLRSQEDTGPLLDYAMRLHAFVGSSLVRVVLTVRNPQAAGRAEDGSRFVLGQSGSAMFKSLDFVVPVRLTEGRKQVTFSAEPGRMLDRIPLTEPMSVYQDSSGGENWFHRSHVNRDNVIPQQFRGYRFSYHNRVVETGLRACPWIDVADMRWAVAAAMPLFWQNFPKALSVDDEGAIHIGLWPGQFDDLHEIQGGEQKTHEFWLYFRHRRTARNVEPMPLARDLMPVCLERPVVLASAGTYTNEAGGLEPMLPVQPGRFPKYEAIIAAAVRDEQNLFTHREEADEYGWRDFGDTWAANEFNQTRGPHNDLRVVSHFNNEYDLGLGMLMQAMRNVDADPLLAKAWWTLGLEALWHEADIDIYHTRTDPSMIYNGGTFTHTAHGVEAGRSTHRGSPRDELWGLLEWPWPRGSSPEAGHLRTRGMLTAYLLTGDRHLRDAAWDVTDLVEWKILNDRFAQIDVPDRTNGNNLQILLDAYLLTWDPRYLEPIRTLTENLDFDVVTKRSGEPNPSSAWQPALYLRSLARLIHVMNDKALPSDHLVTSYLKYVRALYQHVYADHGGWHEGSSSYLASEVMMEAAQITQDPAERAKFIEAGKAAFHALDDKVRADGGGQFWTSKNTTFLLLGGARYEIYAAKQGLEPVE
ncbi:MAG TPA: hypothetical protein VMZ31_06400 [Phycisphaerae bacterium]|nr:hypothetical protein [Phycisphaerae bacterium]